MFGLPGTGGHHLAPAGSSGFAGSPEAGAALGGTQAGFKWSEVADSFPFAFAVLGPNQELLYENAACRALAGFTMSEKGGVEGWLSALSPGADRRDAVLDSWRGYVWRNQLTTPFTLKRANQEVFELEVGASLLGDGGIALVMRDITEQSREEERHRHSHLRFRAVFAHAENGIALVDRTGRIIDANPALAGLAGLSPVSLKRYEFGDLLHPDDALALSRRIEETIAGGPTSTGGAETGPGPAVRAGTGAGEVALPVRVRTRQGERTLKLTWCPIALGAHTPPMGVCLFESAAAAERGDLASQLQLVSSKVRSLLESIPDLILLVDSDLTVVDLIPPPRPWEALAADERWIGQRLTDTAPRLGDLVLGFHEKILADLRTVRGELEGHLEEAYRFSVTASPAGDGQIFIVVRDLLEALVPAPLSGLRASAFEHFPRPFLVVDPDTRVLSANAAALGFLGLSAGELLGSPLGTRFTPADSPGSSENQHFGHLKTGDGRLIPVELETFSVPAAEGDPNFGVLLGEWVPGSERTEPGPGTQDAPREATQDRAEVESVEEFCEEAPASVEERPAPAVLSPAAPGPIGEPEPACGTQPGAAAEAPLGRERAQHQFRNRIQLVTSLFGFEPQGVAARDAFMRWQVRLRALAASEGGAEGGLTAAALCRSIAGEVCSLTRQGPVARLVEIAGGEGSVLLPQRAPAFALLLGELHRMALLTPQPGRGPALVLRFELEEVPGTLCLRARPGEGRRFFFPDRESESEVFGALVEQVQGTVSIPANAASQAWVFHLPVLVA